MKTAKLVITVFLAFLLAGSLAAQENNKSLQVKEIHDAVVAGDLAKVQSLLAADPALLESKDSSGNTPLHQACATSQVAVANYLIDQKANLNARNNSGFTPLLYSTGSQRIDIDLIRRLIAKGADVNAQLNGGYTALIFAAMRDDLAILRLLIEKGADLNVNSDGGTALHRALIFGRNEETAKLLIERGAKLQPLSYGNTELHLAALKGHADLTQLLVKHGADVHAVNQFNRTPLYYAAKHGHRRTADVLVSAGAKKNTTLETNYGKAPQLAATLKDGEAYLWYLGGYYGGGYAVKTKEHLLLFDKTEIDESSEAGLANGRLNPNELASQKITVLVTKALAFGYDMRPFELAKRMPDVTWIFDDKPPISEGHQAIPPYRLAASHESFSVGAIKVHAIPASGRGNGGAVGLGYLVEVDGVKIFHAGFHLSGNTAAQIERYRKEIDSLKPFGPIDIVILSVRGHLPGAYKSYLYLLDQLSPKAVYLMGGDAATEEYPKCAEVLKARNIPVAFPEGGRAVGERFHYLRE